MAGIEFDRQVFTSAAEGQRTQAPKAMGAVFLVLALGLAGFVGYKIFTQASQDHAIASANAQVETLQLQLADSQKRLEELQKHHKAVKPEPPAPVVQAPVVEKKSAPAKPAYRIAAGSALPPQPKAVVYTAPPATPSVANTNTAAIQSKDNTNHYALQATTDPLSDFVVAGGQ